MMVPVNETSNLENFGTKKGIRFINEVINQMTEIIEQLQENIESTFKIMCKAFDSEQYERLLKAFFLMERMYEIPGKLQSAFLGTINFRSKRCIANSIAAKVIIDREILERCLLLFAYLSLLFIFSRLKIK